MESLQNGKARISDQGGVLDILIPSAKNYFVIPFFIFWLGGWTVGGSFALSILLSPNTGGGSAFFMIFWLCMWLIAEISVITIILWMLFGKHLITTDHQSLTIAKTILGFKVLSKSYMIEGIKNLKICETPYVSNSWNRGFNFDAFRRKSGASIKFDYGMKSVYFTGGLDQPEQEHILRLIKDRMTTEQASTF